MKNKIIFLLLFSLIAYSLQLTAVSAQEFDPNYIISDADMVDYESMSMFDIVQFIRSKGGTLYTAKFEDIDGKMKSAPALIYNNSRLYKVNPRVLLVTLQKEQSLVDNPSPTQKNYDWATGWAVCDGCSLSDPKVLKYKGFARQIDGAAGGYGWYMDQFSSGQNGWLIWPKKTTTIDGTVVTPANSATAALYNYTPHLHGNKNFHTLWNKWFAFEYPDGSLLHAEGETDVWVIEDGVRRTFKSLAVLQSRYNYNNVMTVSKNDIDKYPVGSEIKFSNYSLLRAPSGAIYLLVDDEKRHITSMEVFRTLGFNIEEVDEASLEDLSDYNNGTAITMESAYPTGALVQNNQTGGVYWVKDGVKQAIIDRAIMKINYSNFQIFSVAPDELQKYSNGLPAKIKDGTLVKSDELSAVYVISDGMRRPIVSPETFSGMGYSWDNVRTVPQKVVDLHTLGEEVEVTY